MLLYCLLCNKSLSEKAIVSLFIEHLLLARLSIPLDSFNHNFWAFSYISRAPLSPSLWPGYHWKDLSLLQNLNIDDANFGQRWGRQKWVKRQRLSWPVTADTGVNELNMITCNQSVAAEVYCTKKRLRESWIQAAPVNFLVALGTKGRSQGAWEKPLASKGKYSKSLSRTNHWNIPYIWPSIEQENWI